MKKAAYIVFMIVAIIFPIILLYIPLGLMALGVELKLFEIILPPATLILPFGRMFGFGVLILSILAFGESELCQMLISVLVPLLLTIFSGISASVAFFKNRKWRLSVYITLVIDTCLSTILFVSTGTFIYIFPCLINLATFACVRYFCKDEKLPEISVEEVNNIQ